VSDDLKPEAALLEAAGRLAEAERTGDIPALEQLLAPDYQGYDPAGRLQFAPSCCAAILRVKYA
jgi:hypothetical protein